MDDSTRQPGEARLPHPTRRNFAWWSIQLVLRHLFVVWFRYRARGVEKIPVRGGGLVLVNHQSFLDPLLVGAALSRPVSYLARDSLFRVPIVGAILRATYVKPINRESAGTASIRGAVARMEHGFLVGIFPEGTRTRDGSIGVFKPGFVAMIRRTRLPVYPVGIAGANEAFPRDGWQIRPRQIRVVFGDPFTPEELEPLSRRGCEEELLAVVRERVVRCQREAQAWLNTSAGD